MHSWKDLCIDIDKQPFGPLCRAASSAGGLCNRACTSDEISVFINAVLQATDPASSHSLKHTTLEWCSAYGLDEDARKLLGHHSLSGRKALAVYSRDLLNRPLQLYCSMLRNIRLDDFRPDESRTSIPPKPLSQWKCLQPQTRHRSVRRGRSENLEHHLLLLPRVHAKMRVMIASMICSVMTGSLDRCGVTSEVRLFTRHLSLQL